MQDNVKKDSHRKKAANSIEEIAKYYQHFKKRKEHIQKKHEKSIMNQLYIFPRLCYKMDRSTELSSDSEEQIPNIYKLKQQNQVSRKNQTNAKEERSSFLYQQQKIEGHHSKKKKKQVNSHRNSSLIQYNSTKSVKSVQSLEQVSKTLKSRKSKCGKKKNIQITFDTKKKSPNKRKVTSHAKLLIEQYSLDNRAYQSLKRSSKGLLISYRPTKNHEISLSLSSKKVKTSAH